MGLARSVATITSFATSALGVSLTVAASIGLATLPMQDDRIGMIFVYGAGSIAIILAVLFGLAAVVVRPRAWLAWSCLVVAMVFAYADLRLVWLH
jgi:hypothetical protein